jgi:hypothetical protein
MSKKFVTSHEQIADLLHDVGGPVSTAKALQAELERSAQELTDAVDDLGAEVSEDKLSALKSIIEQDILICLQHMGISLNTLQTRLKQFSDTVRES